MNDIEKKYLWLIKHLMLNASKKIGNVFWVKISEKDALILKEAYPIIEIRTLKKDFKVDVIEMEKNNIVLDTRN